MSAPDGAVLSPRVGGTADGDDRQLPRGRAQGGAAVDRVPGGQGPDRSPGGREDVDPAAPGLADLDRPQRRLRDLLGARSGLRDVAGDLGGAGSSATVAP